MTKGYSIPPEQEDGKPCRLWIRRHTDRCFHHVEEVVPDPFGGYILDGFLIPFDEVAEFREEPEKPGGCLNCEEKRKMRERNAKSGGQP